MKVPITVLTLVAIGLLDSSAAVSKKEERKLRKAKKEGIEMKARAESTQKPVLLPVPKIANAPQPPINQSLRLNPRDLAASAKTIDMLVNAGLRKADQVSNPPASDEVFVRRIYLDAAGRIPTAEETAKFINDKSANKRGILIDSLLISDGYRSHQFNWYADMFRFKSGMKRANFNLYQRWIKDGIRTNRGWDRTVHDMVSADGSLASNGATGYLLRDAGMPLDSLSNTLSLFLGANVSCAQCHDHPLAEWTQREFYEMAAYFGAADVSDRDPRKIGNKVKNKLISKQDVIHAVAQNMYRVKTLDENHTKYPDDYAYDDVKPGAKVTPRLIAWTGKDRATDAYKVTGTKPQHDRADFARWMTHSKNPRFAISIANRLWKRSFGIAVQEPVEDLDDIELASNPALLRHLAKLVIMNKFDLRELQRIVFNTQSYQAEASAMPEIGDIDSYLFAGPVLRRMTAEQTWDSILTLAYGASIDEYQIDQSHKATRSKFDYDSFIPPSASGKNKPKERYPIDVEAIAAITTSLKEAGHFKGGKGFAKMDLVGGSPMPRKFGRGYVLRASELPQPERDTHFLRMFGQSSREIADDGSLEGNIPQTLMLMNGGFQELLTDQDSLLMQGSAQRSGISDTIEALYQSFFSRPPSPDESQLIMTAMKKGTSLQDLTWTLFNTPEFLFVQ